MAEKYAYWATSLIGGAEGSLDSIDGTDLNDQDMAIVAVMGDKFYLYSLDADSAAAESSPDVIAPDANGGDKRWILHGVYTNPADIDGFPSDATKYLNGNGSWTDPVWDGDITDINLDGATDIGAALADEDLILVDDGAGGTNRKCTMDRVKTYVITGLSIVYFATVIPTMMTATPGEIDVSHEILTPTMMTTTVSDE